MPLLGSFVLNRVEFLMVTQRGSEASQLCAEAVEARMHVGLGMHVKVDVHARVAPSGGLQCT